MNAARQERTLAAEQPFMHARLIESGQLRVFGGVHARDLQQFLRDRARQPLVVFAGHPSLRCVPAGDRAHCRRALMMSGDSFGDAVHLLRCWSGDAASAVVCIGAVPDAARYRHRHRRRRRPCVRCSAASH